MFDNIGGKIKSLAKIIGIGGMIIGIITFIVASITYSENAEYAEYIYEYSYPSLQKAAKEAVAAKATMKWSAILALTSVVSCWPLYGLGQLIENTDILAAHFKGEGNDSQASQKAIEDELPDI